MILEGNYKTFNLDSFKKKILRTIQCIYGSDVSRLSDVVKSTDIYFYTDENSIWEYVSQSFYGKKKTVITKDIIEGVLPRYKEFYERGIGSQSKEKSYISRYMILNELLDKEEHTGEIMLGDHSNINIVCNMLDVGVDIYTKGMDEDTKAKYMDIYRRVIGVLGLQNESTTMQHQVIIRLNKDIKKVCKKHISRMGDVGTDYLRLKNSYNKKRRDFIEYLDYTYGLTERDKAIISRCDTIDNNILSILDLNGLFFGVDLSCVGDIASFSLDAEVRLLEGDMTESIYAKRVRVMEYINKLPPYDIQPEESWEDVYYSYIAKGYREITKEEYDTLDNYRNMLVGDIVSSTKQISEFLEDIENPVNHGYVVPYGSIDRQSFIYEDSMFIPNAVYGKNGEVVSRSVVCLNDNIHVSEDLALKTLMHELGHGFISRIVEDDKEGFAIDTAMFGKFRYYGDKEYISSDGTQISGYTEPTRLIENINERKSKEMIAVYKDILGLENPFGKPADFEYQYYNSYSLEDCITEKFYGRFKHIIHSDIQHGTYMLRDTVGIKNIMALERVLREFKESRVKREMISKMMVSKNTNVLDIDVSQLSIESQEEYAYFMERVDSIMLNIDRYINRPQNMQSKTEGM